MKENFLRWKPLWIFIFPGLLILASLAQVVIMGGNFTLGIFFSIMQAVFIFASMWSFFVRMLPGKVSGNISLDTIGPVLLIASIIFWILYSVFTAKLNKIKDIWIYLVIIFIILSALMLFSLARVGFTSLSNNLP